MHALPSFARRDVQERSLSLRSSTAWQYGIRSRPRRSSLTVDDDMEDVFRFADLELSPNVTLGLHVLSHDERCLNFQPTLWEQRVGVTQILFPGAHANVGGGYPLEESGLSDLSLLWMTQNLERAGLQFNSPPIDFKPNPDAAMHEPWTNAQFDKLPARDREWNLKRTAFQLEPSLRARLGLPPAAPSA